MLQLFAWVVGDFGYIEATTSKNHGLRPLPVRIYSPRDLISQAGYALQDACRVMDYFARIFATDYPLPKLDLVAIPEFVRIHTATHSYVFPDDYLLSKAHGAMENWGLCTFQNTALLVDEATSSLENRERVSYVIAHGMFSG